ncbi:hypothetical protein DPMN_049609 [Dreissena polymorpha]|uniref:Alpha-2-macroglobulin domain-containing protein n=1 Tax=Dreissena polymorpha TaxID=45954 RepID=A0A9D4CG81_DREPO|nr:hypothetical protein DPMN_049609 [Dreissena polymorpha]
MFKLTAPGPFRSGGVVNFDETVPDTITSWVATAFAVHPQTGLGISEQSAQVSPM